MSVFTFISRRPKVIWRPKHLYTTVNKPAGAVYRPRRWPIKIKRGKKRTMRVAYPVQRAPVGFVPTKHAWPRVRIKRGRKFVRAPRWFQPQLGPVGFIPKKRSWPIKIKRARNLVRWFSIRRLQPQSAPVGFAPTKHAWPKVRIRRGRKFVRAPRFFQPQAAPVGFIPVKRRWPVKIKRGRRFTRKIFPILPSLLLLFRKQPRIKIKRAKTPFRLKRYSIAGPPVSFIPFKKPPRAKIKKGKWDLRRFALRFYEFPGTAPIITAVVEWIIRARRRGRR